MSRIDIGGITLNVAELGDGPPLIFIPGLVGLHEAWKFQLAHFSGHYRCVTFDHRGTGGSDKPSGPGAYSTAVIAGDVIALMDRLGIEATHVVGTSTGGCILQNLAIDHPRRLRGCVFSNSWTAADEFVNRLQLTRKRIAESYGAAEYVRLSSMFTHGAAQFRENLDKVMALEKLALETVAPVEILTARIDMTLEHDRRDELSRIDRPSLVISTADDATVPCYFADDLAAAIPGARKVIFEEGGHYSYRRHPEKWNAIVEQFLRDCDARI